MEFPMLFILPFFIVSIGASVSNLYYLVGIDQTLSSNDSYCSAALVNERTYRIPDQCHHHLLCNAYHCDDQAVRCLKIREALCCLHDHLQLHCLQSSFVRTKDLFRSVYFQISIEHGYCEINLERIEQTDRQYCLGDHDDLLAMTTTISTPIRPPFKHFHRRPSTSRPNRDRYRLAARQNHTSLADINYLRQVTIIEEKTTSTCAVNVPDLALVLLFSLSFVV